MTSTTRKKEICDVDFYRDEDGKQVLHIKLVPELEKLFASRETSVSDRYLDSDGDGLEFYNLKDNLTEYADKYNASRNKGLPVFLRDYGTELLQNNHANMSILRTVDISDGVKVVVEGLILEDEVGEWFTSLAHFLNFLHNNFIQKTSVKANISLEV